MKYLTISKEDAQTELRLIEEHELKTRGCISIGQYLDVKKLPQPPNRKTAKWQILTKRGDILGLVVWYSGWRQYIFQPAANTDYSFGCLKDIANFIKQQRPEAK